MPWRLGRTTTVALSLIALFLFLLWATLAVWIDGPGSRPLAGALVALLWAPGIAALWRVRPIWRALSLAVLPGLLVIIWWLSIPPSNDREWMEDVRELPWTEIHDDQLIVHNLRNFDYRSETDFTPHWETRTFDLAQIRGVDLFLCFWGPTAIAHTIMSWEFADGQHLAISIETRKQAGESYSAVLGFFRQYELYYVVADERDVVRLRTNYRGEQVYLYRLRADPARARAILLDYLGEVNRLSRAPKWYNALTHNCTTTIRHHVQNVSQGYPFSWKLLANGYLDELAYERGNVDTSLPFAELKARSDVSARARAADQDPAFSARIREGLPDPRAAEPPP